MSADLRAAVVGCGRMGAYHAGTLARRLAGVSLAAVSDPDAGAARRLADELGTRAYAAADEAIAAADAVVIAAPSEFHADLAVAAARAGRHVFCEKPMGRTPQEADRAARRPATPAWCCRPASSAASRPTGARPGRGWTAASWAGRGCCAR